MFGWLRRLWKGSAARKKAVVTFDQRGVKCLRPTGLTEEVSWDELTDVEIVTTDAGPFIEDVFWVLHGADRGCSVPQKADGCKELLERLQKLLGFNNEAVINAMCCTSNS